MERKHTALLITGAVIGGVIGYVVGSGDDLPGWLDWLDGFPSWVVGLAFGALIGALVGLFIAEMTDASASDDSDGTAKSWGLRGVGRSGILVMTVLIIAVSISLFSALITNWPGPGVDIETIAAAEGERYACAGPEQSAPPEGELPDGGLQVPAGDCSVVGEAVKAEQVEIKRAEASQERDRILLITVAIAGALGAMGHVTISFYRFVGARKLVWSWVPQYFLIPVVGALLAGVTYIVIRAGLVTGNVQGDPYGLVAIAALTGLFSSQAMAKLKQIFETVFTAPGQGPDALNDPVPQITGLDPGSGGPGTVVIITATGVEGATAVSFPGDVSSEATRDAAAGTLTTKVPFGVGHATGKLSIVYGTKKIETQQDFSTTPVPSDFAVTKVDPSPAEVDQLVTITGSGLRGATAVVFHPDKPAEATVAADFGSLTATVPSDAETGPLKIAFGDVIADPEQELTLKD